MQDPGSQPSSEAAHAIAVEQAAKDAALMEQLQAKRATASKAILADVAAGEDEAEQQAFTIRAPMNRKQRREQVKFYASMLAQSERQVPVVNPTIIPKSSRRRRAGQKGRLQHAR